MRVYEEAHKPRPAGLIPPNTVAGPSAADYYALLGGEVVPQHLADAFNLDSASRDRWLSDRARLEAAGGPAVPNLPAPTSEATTPDIITDTVGVVVIDTFGGMAAGSSSGGVGLKHRGRMGPAAIIGASTSVRPNLGDNKQAACVVSGSGESITVTNASAFASERLYDGMRRNASGRLEECGDDEVLPAFVKKEFLGILSRNHRSIQISNTQQSIQESRTTA